MEKKKNRFAKKKHTQQNCGTVSLNKLYRFYALFSVHFIPSVAIKPLIRSMQVLHILYYYYFSHRHHRQWSTISHQLMRKSVNKW